LFGWFGRDSKPLTIHDWEHYVGGEPDFGKGNVKSCSTEKPRYVITDQMQDRYVVYTESLATCLGVLIHGKGRQAGDVAALVHALAGRISEADRVKNVVKKLISNYDIQNLEVIIVIGDQPDPELFNKIIKALMQFDIIPDSNFRLMYGGEGEPDFENGFKNSKKYVSKIAYDTRHHGLFVGSEMK